MTEDDFNAWKDSEAFQWFATRCRAHIKLIETAMSADALSRAAESAETWAAIQIPLANRKGYVEAINDILTMEYHEIEE